MVTFEGCIAGFCKSELFLNYIGLCKFRQIILIAIHIFLRKIWRPIFKPFYDTYVSYDLTFFKTICLLQGKICIWGLLRVLPIFLLNCYDTLTQYFTQKVVSQSSTQEWAGANGFRKSYRLNVIIKGYIFYSLYAMPLGPLTEQLLESKIASITKYGTVDCSNSKLHTFDVL